MVCGLTLGEYIRKRKLTKAAIDILMKNESVTTIAFKYGYSPDGFTRAFKKNYKYTPSSLKDISQITLFNRFNVENFVKGEIINYRIMEKQSFEVLGYKKHFNCNLEERKSYRNVA